MAGFFKLRRKQNHKFKNPGNRKIQIIPGKKNIIGKFGILEGARERERARENGNILKMTGKTRHNADNK